MPSKKSAETIATPPDPSPVKKAALFDAKQAAEFLGLTVGEIEAEMTAENLPAKLPFTKRNLERYKEHDPDYKERIEAEQEAKAATQ